MGSALKRKEKQTKPLARANVWVSKKEAATEKRVRTSLLFYCQVE
jgi:hypothetical protein